MASAEPPPDTNELMERARAGSPTAVNDLLARRREWLAAIIRARLDRRLRRRVGVSDVVQDVLLEASQRLRAYLDDPQMPFALWLKRLADDRIIDLHRRNVLAAKRSLEREQPAPSHGGTFGAALDPALTPAAALLRQELHERFLDALALLDETDREVLCLRHFDQLPSSQVATALGLTPAAAGMRYLRALRRLREALGQDPFEQGKPT